MKKAFLLMMMFSCALLSAAQQNVTLKFTSTTPSGSYFPFDMVNVTNVTRGWTESLVYPDTTMVLTSYDGLHEDYNDGFMSEAYPNPFNGSANVLFNIGKAGQITAEVMNMNGQRLTEFSGFVDQGTHQLTINLDKPQIAFIVITTSNSQFTKKIINTGCGDYNKIEINRLDATYNKSRDGGEFVIGDEMSYFAVAQSNGNTIYSNIVTQAQYNDETIVLTFSIPTPDHTYVDLGLPSGLLWATCNVGADNPEEYGDYFAWGETTPKDYYDWSTYQYCNGSINTMTKYCSNSSYGYNGFTDDLTVLLPEDDAATANWGDGWRMPTEEEFQELYNNTTVTWTTQNGENGRLFTASNGNSLFLPAAGYRIHSSLGYAGSLGNYRSSSLYTGIPNCAWSFYFDSGNYDMGNGGRYFGQSVRPVRSGQN